MANGTLKVSNIQTSSGSGTITLGASGETVDLSNGTITLNSSMKNTPNFLVKRSGNQSISLNTTTKVQFDSETYDSASAYDNSSNYRFTPQTSGKYHLYSNVYLANGSNANNTEYTIRIYKNGSAIALSHLDHRTGGIGYQQSIPIAVVAEANGSTDYFEIYISGNWTGGSINATSNSFFGGYKIIE
tara:strand:+ start:605 stop:1165 length:561 start_codon:yes stop_codon:yes gene_type:complete